MSRYTLNAQLNDETPIDLGSMPFDSLEQAAEYLDGRFESDEYPWPDTHEAVLTDTTTGQRFWYSGAGWIDYITGELV